MSKNKSVGNLPTCKGLIFRCKDFRLNDKGEKWIKFNLFKKKDKYDIISLAGASKNFADGNKWIRSYLLEEIRHSIDHHGIEAVILFHHSDCGAYVDYHGSLEEEKEKQLEDMEKARDIIQDKFPELEIVLLWYNIKRAGKDGSFEVIS